MKLFILLILTMVMMTATIYGQTMPPVETGVSQTLAKWRAANYSDVRYKLNITLEKGAALMRGEIEIRVTLTDEGAKNDLILDWRTTQFANDKDKPFADVVSVNTTVMGKATQSASYDYQTLKEHLLISPRFFKAGENTIKIKFSSPIKTSGAAITRYVDKEDGAEYVYSLFVPSDASTAFPVFDQPDLKARFQLNVKAPKNWKAISNTTSQVLFISGNDNYIPDDHSYHEFAETKPISTYVFAFAAGEFAEFTEGTQDPPYAQLQIDGKKQPFEINNELIERINPRIYVRKSQAGKFKQHAAEVFRLNREGVRFLESWFDYKFPFPKYDLVLIPEFPFGGMEHAGATFLREDRVIFPTEPTKNDYITRANVIFHEAAHQWFGDTVTMRWFDDLWLKEGFAEFMAYKTLAKVMPEYNAWKIFYERNKQAAYLTDSTRGTTPIYQEIENLSAAKSAYGNIVYRKAPSFLRQAEFYLGEDKFQTAVRAFLKKHEFANAEWTDLVKEFEDAAWFSSIAFYHPSDAENVTKEAEEVRRKYIRDWANDWVKQSGLPTVKVIVNRNEGLLGVALEEVNSTNLRWKQDTKLYIRTGENSAKIFNRSIPPGWREAQTLGSIILSVPQNANVFVFPNYQDYGYGIFLLDERSRAYVLANIQTEKDDFLRTMMWGALWDSVREGELNPKDYVALVIKNINVETDESTIQTLLGRVSTAMNYYLSDKQRDELTPRLEDLLVIRMTTAKTQGQRLTFYRAFVNIASTKTGAMVMKEVLELNNNATQKEIEESKKDLIINKNSIWNFRIPVIGKKDKFDTITKLIILGDKDAPQLLEDSIKSDVSDETKRYAYAAKAGIGTTENTAKFWNDFTSNKEISESWIESAFVPFNTVRHSELTLPYLEKALAELPSLKKNRKIFFINGWLAAFVGGQRSEQALAIVNKFLADNPNLDRDLRLKILETADGLERAVKIRKKFAG